MTRARGQPSKAIIRQTWPHAVVLDADTVRERFAEIHAANLAASGNPVPETVRQDDHDFIVYRFRSADAADAFAAHFDGKLSHPV